MMRVLTGSETKQKELVPTLVGGNRTHVVVCLRSTKECLSFPPRLNRFTQNPPPLTPPPLFLLSTIYYCVSYMHFPGTFLQLVMDRSAPTLLRTMEKGQGTGVLKETSTIAVAAVAKMFVGDVIEEGFVQRTYFVFRFLFV